MVKKQRTKKIVTLADVMSRPKPEPVKDVKKKKNKHKK